MARILRFWTKVAFSINVVGSALSDDDIKGMNMYFKPEATGASGSGAEYWIIQGDDFDEVYEKMTKIKEKLDAAR